MDPTSISVEKNLVYNASFIIYIREEYRGSLI